jgi:hypothetical protein
MHKLRIKYLLSVLAMDEGKEERKDLSADHKPQGLEEGWRRLMSPYCNGGV